MSTIEESIDVEVPVPSAYNQWTQFEEFPTFMEGSSRSRSSTTHTCTGQPRSEACNVRCNVCPMTATLSPTGVSSGGSLGDSAEMTNERDADRIALAPSPSPSSRR